MGYTALRLSQAALEFINPLAPKCPHDVVNLSVVSCLVPRLYLHSRTQTDRSELVPRLYLHSRTQTDRSELVPRLYLHSRTQTDRSELVPRLYLRACAQTNQRSVTDWSEYERAGKAWKRTSSGTTITQRQASKKLIYRTSRPRCTRQANRWFKRYISFGSTCICLQSATIDHKVVKNNEIVV